MDEYVVSWQLKVVFWTILARSRRNGIAMSRDSSRYVVLIFYWNRTDDNDGHLQQSFRDVGFKCWDRDSRISSVLPFHINPKLGVLIISAYGQGNIKHSAMLQ